MGSVAEGPGDRLLFGLLAIILRSGMMRGNGRGIVK